MSLQPGKSRRNVTTPEPAVWIGLSCALGGVILLCVDGEKFGHNPLIVWCGVLVGIATTLLHYRGRDYILGVLWIMPACAIVSLFVPSEAGSGRALWQGLFTGFCLVVIFGILSGCLSEINAWIAWKMVVLQRHDAYEKANWASHTESAFETAFLLNEKVIVTLVHGTFAADANWKERGSPLYEHIRRELGEQSEIHAFVWSGGNSHADRVGAGKALAAHLAQLSELAPDKKHLIVAHSHGGNVVLYALRQRPALIPTIAGVVTMATPFITVRRRKIRDAMQILSWLAPPFLVLLTVVVFGQFTPLRQFGGLVTISGMAILLLGWKSVRRWMGGPLAISLCQKQRRIAEQLDNRPPMQVPLIYAYVSYDEAGLGLKSLHLLGGLGHNALLLLRYCLFIGLISNIVVGLTLAIASEFNPSLRRVYNVTVEKLSYGSAVVILLYLACVVFAAVWPWLVRGHKLGFGRDSIWTDFLLDIGASIAPPPGMHGTPIGVHVANYSGLRHSYLYSSPEFLAELSEWLAGTTLRKPILSQKGSMRFERWAPLLAGAAYLAIVLTTFYSNH